MPHYDLEAEAAVLGAIILLPQCLDEIRLLIGPADFYDDANVKTAEAIWALTEARNGALDIVQLIGWLKDHGTFEAVGGAAHLYKISQASPNAAHARYHASRVRELSLRRALVESLSVSLHAAWEACDESIEEILGTAEASVYAVRERAVANVKDRTITEIVHAAMDSLERRMRGEADETVPTEFSDLDLKMQRGMRPGHLLVLAARPSMGKAQPLDAKVLTPLGWAQMGSLRVGDALASIDGMPSLVQGVHPRGRQQVYRITFSDGRSTECCAEHLWKVSYRNWESPRVLTTQKLIEMLKLKRYANRLWIDAFSGEFGSDADLPIDPWLLGYLLGNGCLRSGTARFSTPDQETVVRAAATAGDEFKVTRGGKYDYRLVQASGCNQKGTPGVVPNSVITAIKELGLWKKLSPEKWIPDIYKMSTRENRRRLLCGLIDSDGWVEKWGSLRFGTSSERLARDVVDLMRSLGGTGAYFPRSPTYTHRGGTHKGLPAFVCNLQHPNASQFAELSRKSVRLAPVRQRQRRLNVMSIEPSRITETQCISVTHESRLYITDDFTITHNSALAANIAEQVAAGGKRVLFVSLEMPSQELVERMLARNSRVSGSRMRAGSCTPDERNRIVESAARLSQIPLHVEDYSSLRVGDIAAMSRRLKRRYGDLGLVVIDYLQLITPESGKRGERRDEEVAKMTRSLKALAKELSVPVLVLAQLNREAAKERDHRPKLHHLRESGAIEQDADVVLFVHREEYYMNDTDPEYAAAQGIAEIIVAKQRGGETGTVKMAWVKDYISFETIAPERFGAFDDWNSLRERVAEDAAPFGGEVWNSPARVTF
jgi:replicative DNA helicase